MTITKIISGGQTGADRGGLDAAIELEVPHDGGCPKGRKAEDGVIPDKYDLQETESGDYLDRAEANVVEADATVIFTYCPMQGGSLRTAEFCRKHGKPYCHVNLEGMWSPRAVDRQTSLPLCKPAARCGPTGGLGKSTLREPPGRSTKCRA